MMESKQFIRGLVAHLVADWLLQNDWMAQNKSNPNHPAGIVHAVIHTVFLMFVFPTRIAAVIGLLHYIVDLRWLLAWWRKVFGQTTEGPAAIHVAFWGDQVVHIVLIWIAAWWNNRTSPKR